MLTINKTGLFTAEVFELYRLIFGFDEKGNKVNFKETKPQISSNNDQILSNLNILLGSGCHNHDCTLGDIHDKN